MGDKHKRESGEEKRRPPDIQAATFSHELSNPFTPKATERRRAAIREVIEVSLKYITSRDVEGDVKSLVVFIPRNFDGPFKRVRGAAADKEEWQLLAEEEPGLCSLYVAGMNIINIERAGENISRQEVEWLGDVVIDNLSNVTAATTPHQIVVNLKMLIPRIFSQLALDYSNDLSYTAKKAPTQLSYRSPKEVPLRDSAKSLENTSPADNQRSKLPTKSQASKSSTESKASESTRTAERANKGRPKSPKIRPKTRNRVTKWYTKIVDIVPSKIPTWALGLAVPISLLALVLTAALCFFLLSFLIPSIPSVPRFRHQSVPEIPVVFPNGTKVSYDMSDQLQAYSEHMKNTVQIYDHSEAKIDSVIGTLLADTEKFIHKLESVVSPPWWAWLAEYETFQPFLKLLSIQIPPIEDVDQMTEEFTRNAQTTIQRFPAQEKEAFKSAIDQLDAHLSRIQKSTLGHDVKLQFSKFFHELSHLNLSHLFDDVETKDVATSLAMLKMFNERYRDLGEVFVFALYEKMGEFGKALDKVVEERAPEEIKGLNARLREALKDAFKSRQSLEAWRKEKGVGHDKEL